MCKTGPLSQKAQDIVSVQNIENICVPQLLRIKKLPTQVQNLLKKAVFINGNSSGL